VLPSVFGEKNLTFRENEHVSVINDEDEFNNATGLEVAKAVDGRAVLVFFESETKMQTWRDSAYGQRVPDATISCIKSDTKDLSLKVETAESNALRASHAALSRTRTWLGLSLL